MLRTLTDFKLLTPWMHDEHLDEAVFRLAATFPLHESQHKAYMIPGDEYYPFDPNSFVQRLVEETGIAHVWEPVPTKVPDGGRTFVTSSFAVQGQVRDPDRDATQKARQLLWEIWRRFAGVDESLTRRNGDRDSQLATILFADFLIGNTDLVQQVVAEFRKNEWVGMDLLVELENRARKPL
jgi:hypothetical protein